MRRILQHHLLERKLPVLGKHLNVSGLLIIAWLLLLYGAVIGIWWWRLRDYFEERGVAGGITKGNYILAATALTGHFCDITMGMVLLPISRHSALASFFKLSASTTLAFHMIQAYVLFTLVLVHGFLYVSWLPIFHSLSTTLKTVYPVLNPTYLYHEAWPGNTGSLGIWRASLPFTGLFTTTIMLAIFITTLPGIRRRYFNVFYFTHLAVIIALIVICLHASTMFYCTATGLVLWLVDWAMRVYELWSPVDGRVTTIGKGYYVLDMTMPRNRLDGCACTSPLAHFYIYHSDSSSRELHPFTTITHLASENVQTPPEESDIRIQFLFRKRINKPKAAEVLIEEHQGVTAGIRALLRPKRKTKIQWTEKLASHADPASHTPLQLSQKKEGIVQATGGELEMSKSRQSSITALGDAHPHPVIPVSLRLEGPYFTPADPAKYRTVICLVAGTGISGGIAIANAFAETQRQRAGKLPIACGFGSGAKCMANAANGVWDRCVVVWSVREEDFVEMPFLSNHPTSGLEVIYQLTGNGRKRMDFSETLSSILNPSSSGDRSPSTASGPIKPKIGDNSTWVYLSGPNAFITTGEKACQAAGVDFYGARWEI